MAQYAGYKPLQYSREESQPTQEQENCDYCHNPSPHRDCVFPDGTHRYLGGIDDFGFIVIEKQVGKCPKCGRLLHEVSKEASDE